MRSTLKFFFRHYVFWFVVFIFFRILFTASLYPFHHDVSFHDLAFTLFAGFRLDISTASYFAFVPFVFAIIAAFTDNSRIFSFLRFYYLLLILAVILLSIANILVYRSWGTLLNSRGLAFAAQPKEMLASVTTMQLFFYLGIIGLLFILIKKLYMNYVHAAFLEITGTLPRKLIMLVLLFPILGIGLRGGLQLIPVNESAAVFSSNRDLNQAAINNIWYLVHNLRQSKRDSGNPYVWMKNSEAAGLIDNLFLKDNRVHTKFLNGGSKPNIVILLLESWTADIIEPMGGEKNVTPQFTRLCKEGLLFTSVYSSGFRTDQALVSVLSGFPAQPNRSIIRFPDKSPKLPSVAERLVENGYHTSFYYGGEIEFSNMNSYLLSSGFSRTISEDDFSEDMRNSKWGAHDQYVLEKQGRELGSEIQPFLSVLLTLSTHEPFEVPVETPFNDNDDADKFRKSAWYTDKCLGEYFDSIRNKSWCQNTVFILMADHGHMLPRKRDYLDPAIRRIPVLVWSPLLMPEYKGTSNPVLGNQNDIAATLLAELGLDHRDFHWSNDLLNPKRNNFAYLNQDAAITWLTDKDTCVVPLEPGVENVRKNGSSCNNAKAYLQHLYGTFLAY